MMQLPCPWCGPRDETEFGYGGQAHVDYPADPSALSDAEWAQFLFFRDNPAGPFAERWVHSGACRRWFNVVRDTRTYTVLAAYRPGDPRPDLEPAPSATTPTVSSPAASTEALPAKGL